MHFLSPVFAAFTLLFGVPVVIHLVGRSRARVRPFPAMVFLLRSHRRVARRTKLRQILLLLLRALVMAAVPLCLSRPFFETTSDLPVQVSAAQSAVLILDDSLAMNYALGGQSLLLRAQARARRIVDALPRDAEVALVLGSRGTAAPVPELSLDRVRLLRAISMVRPTHRPADLLGALKRGAQILSSGRAAGRRIYLLSTLSAQSLPSGVAAPPEVEVVPVDVAEGEALPNRAVADLRVEPAPSLGHRGVRVVAEVVNHGTAPLKEVPVTLVVDGKPVARGLLDLPARGRATKRFYHVLGQRTGRGDGADEGEPAASESAPAERGKAAESPAGIHDIVVELQQDALPADDRRYVRMEVQRTLRVLLVDGDPRNLRRDDEVFYLETALHPGDREDAPIDVSTASSEDFLLRGGEGARGESSADALRDYEAVFLCNVKAQELPRPKLKVLREFVQSGGGLLLSMGDNVDAEAYNGALPDLLPQPLATTKTTGPVRAPGAPAEEEVAREATLTGVGERLGRIDRRHPLLLPFSGGHSLESLQEARFSRYMLLRPTPRSSEGGDKGAGTQVILSYDTGAPALLERQVGSGRVLLFTSSLDRDWNDLPIQPAFLPLMQQAVRYLSRAPLREPEPPALVGQRHEIKLHESDARVEVTLPSAEKRLFEKERLQGRRRLGFVDTDEPGLYRVAVAGEGGALRPRPAESFVVNVDPAESDLQRAPAPRLLALSRPVGEDGDGGKGPVARRRVELWHGIGVLLLVLLLGEALLLREN